MPCRLLLVDDHPALMQGLAALLGQEPDLEVCGQFSTGAALLDYLGQAPAADLALLDLYLPPPLDGLALLPRLRREWPALRVLVFSSAASGVLVSQVAALGAHGYLDKSAEAGTLLAVIRAVHAGQLVFPGRVRPQLRPGGERPPQGPPPGPAEALASDILRRLRQLTAREREIISLVREGYSSRAIAERLALSELTVSTHRRNILRKLSLHGVADLIRFAHEHRL